MAGFPKRARKLSLRTLTELHQTGMALFHHPFKVFYLIRPVPSGAHPECKIVVSVSKRNFKRAVDRNRIKRQMREAFRLNSNALNQELRLCHRQIDLLCLYLPHEHTATPLLSNKMESLLARLTRLVAQADAPPIDRID